MEFVFLSRLGGISTLFRHAEKKNQKETEE